MIVMVGSRAPGTHPLSGLGARAAHGAERDEETGVPKEAYAPFDRGGVGPMPNGALPD